MQRKKLAAAAALVAVLSAVIIALILSTMMDTYFTAKEQEDYERQAGIISLLSEELLARGEAYYARQALSKCMDDYIIKIGITDGSGEELTYASNEAKLRAYGDEAITDAYRINGGQVFITRACSFTASDAVLKAGGSLTLGIVTACAAAVALIAVAAGLLAKPIMRWFNKEAQEK